MFAAKIALGVLGLVLGYIVYCFFHALIQFVVGKLLGFDFLYMVLVFLHIKKENGKVTCKVTNPELGSKVAMFKRKSTDTDSVVYECLPVILSFIPLLIFLFLSGKAGNLFAPVDLQAAGKYMLFVPFILRGWLVIAVLDLVLKIISFKAYFSNDPSSVIIRKNRDLINQVVMGIRPRELEIDPKPEIKDSMSSNDLSYLLFDYYYHLDRGEYDELGRYIEVFAKHSPQVYSQRYMPYFQEMLFYYSYTGDLTAAQNLFSMIENDFVGDKDINGRRVYAYFLYYTNKGAKRALETAKEGLANAAAFQAPGIAEMEKDLLNNLIDTIHKEGDVL